MKDGDASLTGKTVLITGAARRVGAAIARTLHGAGANLVVHYRKSAAKRRSARRRAQCRARRRSAAIVQADLLDIAQAARARWNSRVRSFGGLDVLVNNASTFYPDASSAKSRRPRGTISSAAISRRRCSCRRRRRRRCASRSGLILNIVDIHALRPLRNYTVYCAAKAGLHMLTRSLAKELGPEMRVNGISPGPVMWPEHGGDEARAREDHPAHDPAEDGHARRHRAHRAVLRGARRRSSPGRSSPWMAAAASPGRSGERKGRCVLPRCDEKDSGRERFLVTSSSSELVAHAHRVTRAVILEPPHLLRRNGRASARPRP